MDDSGVVVFTLQEYQRLMFSIFVGGVILLTFVVTFFCTTLHFEKECKRKDEALSAKDDYDKAETFRAIKQRLDAETECADSYIRAKRIQAELEDLPKLLTHDKTIRWLP